MKIFYHPEIMTTDKAKMLLAVQTKDGRLKGYEDHFAAIMVRLAVLIARAVEEGEDAYEMVENYLGITLYPDKAVHLAYQILHAPQMQSLLSSTLKGWEEINSKQEKTSQTLIEDPKSPIAIIDMEGKEKTEDYFEEMTLRHYLEQISMIDEAY